MQLAESLLRMVTGLASPKQGRPGRRDFWELQGTFLGISGALHKAPGPTVTRGVGDWGTNAPKTSAFCWPEQ